MKNVSYINAGAGSGKTWTLSHRLSDALLHADASQRVDPSQVILTTFTRAAAAEFREKARAVLIEAGKPDVAAALEGAAIGTVHSVCEQFVKKYWYRLGLSPVLSVLQEDDKQIYVEQSIAAVLKGKEADIALFNDFRRDFNVVRKDENFVTYPYPDWWKDALKEIISMMSYYDIKDLKESADRSCDEVDTIFNGPDLDTKPLKDFLRDYETYVGGLSKAPKDAMGAVRSIKASLGTIPSLVRTLDIIDAKFAGGVKKGQAAFLQMFPSFDFVVFRNYLNRQMVSRTFGARVKEVIRKVFSLAGDWQEKYRKYKESNHVLDFDDLEHYFLQMLHDSGFEDVRDEIKGTYKLLMVDEFQDSNPVQIAIFDALSDLIADGGGQTMCVGDPKQSIYAFRGSDMELVATETAKFSREAPLDTSYRSRPRLVELSNKVFLQAFGGLLKKADIELPNQDRDNTELVGREPILHWEASDRYQDLAKKISEILYGNPWKVCEKKEKGEKAGKERPIRPKDIAVLFRTGFEVKAAVAALREQGIPVTSSNMDMINWAECQLLLALLRWMNNPYDDGAKADIWHLMEDVDTKDVLLDRKAFMALPDPLRKNWLMKKDLFLKLDEIRNRVHTLPVSDIISTLVLELDLMRLCQKWGHPVARCKNLGLLQKIAAQYEDHCVQMNLASSIPGFINYVHTMSDDLKNEDTTSDTVKVITYHKSKGLEWPVVILGSLEREVDNDEIIAARCYTGITNCKNPAGTNFIFFMPAVKGSSKTLPEKIQDRVEKSALYKDIKERYLREETRLLYVGLTRARDYVVTLSETGECLNWIEDCHCGTGDLTVTGGKVNPWNQPGYEADFCSIANLTAFAPLSRPAASVVVPAPAASHLKKYVSPSKLDAKVKVSLTQAWQGNTMTHAIKDSAECGTCVHNFFAAYRPDAGDAGNEAVAKRLIDGAGLAAQLPSPASLAASARQFFDWIAKEHPGNAESKREVPFLFKSDGVVLPPDVLADGQTARGEMDLVWVKDADRKTCVLVDYKSYHNSPDLDSPDENVRKHYQGYAPQLLAYKKALEQDGWTVEDVLIYYFVQGRVVRFTYE